jgi:hypothetical protein
MIRAVTMDLGQKLLKIEEGRLFVRRVGDQSPSGPETHVVLGVVEVPDSLEPELTRVVRLNSSLWVDDLRGRVFDQRWPEEYGVTDILTAQKWGKGAIPDQFEMFFRRSALPARQGHYWAIAAGVTLGDAPELGVHELTKDGLVHIDRTTRNGEALRSVLSEPIWGGAAFGGPFALMVDLRLDAQEQILSKSREDSITRDPMFGRFAKKMAEHPSHGKLYLTADELRDRRAAGKRIMNEILAGAEGEEAGMQKEPAATRRPAPGR